VIIGVTFEDTLRKLARLNSINENGVKLDEVISQLQSSNILTDIEAKRARSSAAVRTSAAHARWEEFKKEDVSSTLIFTRELILKVDSTL
jgi:DNA-binding transcriptional MerR regulator